MNLINIIPTQMPVPLDFLRVYSLSCIPSLLTTYRDIHRITYNYLLRCDQLQYLKQLIPCCFPSLSSLFLLILLSYLIYQSCRQFIPWSWVKKNLLICKNIKIPFFFALYSTIHLIEGPAHQASTPITFLQRKEKKQLLDQFDDTTTKQFNFLSFLTEERTFQNKI